MRKQSRAVSTLNRLRSYALPGLAGLGATALGTLAYAYTVGRVRLEVERYHLPLNTLAPEFHGYRIVQFSDLHAETSLTRERLYELVEVVNAEQPDLIAITGDFVNEEVRGVALELPAILRRLRPRDATLAIFGNHDHWKATDAVARLIRESDMINISNDVYTLRRGQAALHIAGVDSLTEQRARLDLVLNCLPPDGAAILLAHEPDFADVSAATRRFDLQLSGHSHGGQVRVPGFMQAVLPRHAHGYTIGPYVVGDMLLYTNRGIGTSGLPLRLNCRPEVTVFNLLSPQVSDPDLPPDFESG